MNTVMKKIVTLFMLSIILSMNVTYAAAVGSFYVTGQDGIENIIRETDTASVVAQVALTAAPDATNASIRTVIVRNAATQDYTSFNSCTHELGQSFYLCTYAQSINLTGYAQANLEVGYLNAAGQLVESSTIPFYSDQAPPVITPDSFTASQNGPNVSVSFSVTDSISSLGGYANICSGFKEVIVKLDNAPIGTVQLNSSSCSQTITSLSIPTPANTDGLKSVQVQVVDNVGLVSNQEGDIVTFDATPPSINNIRFVSGNIDPITDISDFGDSVRIKFETEDAQTASVSVDSVVAGTPIIKSVTCESNGDCQSEEFTIVEHRDYVIAVTARDTVGNPNTQTVTRTIAKDDQSDVILSVNSNISQSGVQYLSQNSKLTANIQASGSGYSRQQIALRVEDQVFAPNNCTPSTGNVWACVWDPVSVTHLGSNVEKSVEVQIVGVGGNAFAKDDAGNDVSFDSTNVEYIYDDLAPQNIAHTTIIPFGAGFSYDFPVSYSDLAFNVSYNDISPVTIYVNASELGKSQLVTKDCSTQECAVTTGAIGPGPYNNRMEIEVVDVVGNAARITTDLVEVLQTNYSENTSAFDHDLALSPSALERSSSEYFGQKAFADVLIRPENGGVLEARLVGCRNIDEDDLSGGSPEGETLDFIESLLSNQNSRGDLAYVGGFNMIDTLYNDDGTASILFTVDFLKKELQQETIAFYCDIDVAGTWGNQFVPRETESILLQFSTYNFSLGTLPDNYEADLAEAKAVAEDHISSQLGWLRSLFEIARTLCTLWSLYQTISPIIANPGEFFKIDGMAMMATPPTAPIGAKVLGMGIELSCTGNGMKITADTTIAGAEAAAGGILKGACMFVTCELNLAGGLFGMASGDGFMAGAGTSTENGILNNLNIGPDNRVTGEGQAARFNPLSTSYSGSKDNLVSSVINLCIPGILYNLEKDRQIECKYALCLQDDVPQGLPKEACEAQKAYAKCAFVTGGVMEWLLNSLPIVSLIQQIRNLLADPLGALGLAFGITCAVNRCSPDFSGSLACGAVQLGEILSTVMNIITMITTVTSFFDDEAQLDYCSELGLEESSLF